MDGIIGELVRAGVEEKSVREKHGEAYAPCTAGSLGETLKSLSSAGFELVNLFCAEGFDGKKGFTIFYALAKRGKPGMAMLVVPLAGSEAASVAHLFPSASWYEREVSDGFGIRFSESFDARRLFLHECYPEGFHPLLKSFKNGPVPKGGDKAADCTPEYRFRTIDGEGVYEIPVGPVHAGIIEPGHFRFSAIGETIYNLEVRMFYKHRGVEKLAEGKTPEECVKIAEAISGDESVANSVAFCGAVEKISGIEVPQRAVLLRTAMLELERIYSHLSDMAGMVVDVAFTAGASPFFELREEIFRKNSELTGSRFMKGAVCVGGLRKDLEGNALAALPDFLDSLSKRFSKAYGAIKSEPSVIDRFETTGVIDKGLIWPLHITGPAARASGGRGDVRADQPYCAYGQVSPDVKTAEAGDVLARFEVKAAELRESICIIKSALKGLPEGGVKADAKILDGWAGFRIEAPRGENFHWVWINKGRIERYKARTASFCNWQAIQHAVIGNIIPDFPLINKSLNLSYAGTDL